MPQFVLKLKDIDEFAREHRFAITRPWLVSALEGTSLSAPDQGAQGALAVSVQRSGRDVWVTGRIQAQVVAECVRCLEDARVQVDTRVETLFTPGPPGAVSEDSDEPPPERYSGEELILDGLVREQIIVEIPMQPLCREGCPGIEVPARVRPPADFGEPAQAGIDPRLSPLRNLAVKAHSEE